jgi:hypothetical protein
VHGQDAADKLTDSIGRNRTFRDTYRSVVEQPEAARQAAAASATAPGLLRRITGLLLNPDPDASHAEMARILSAQGPAALARVGALADTLSRRAAQMPNINRYGGLPIGRAALVAGGSYLHNRNVPPSYPQQAD